MLVKTMFVATNICCDKHVVATQIFFSNEIVMTSILLSQQRTCFVATKMILVAAPASDSKQPLILIC